MSDKWTDFYVKGFDWDKWEKSLRKNIKKARPKNTPKESMLIETEPGLFKDTKTIFERIKEYRGEDINDV